MSRQPVNAVLNWPVLRFAVVEWVSSESDMSAVIRGPARLWNVMSALAGERLNTRSSSRPTHFVWSRAFALLCDDNGGFDFVRRQRGGGRPALRFPAGAYADIRDGDLVWVRITALPQFVDEVLPHIHARFALVTGDEDWSIPSGFDQASHMITNPNVLCWFTQNHDGSDDSGKVFPIPIGVDFHTISRRRKWGHWRATPEQQEIELEEIRATMPANRDRLVRAHADFHFNKPVNSFNGEHRDHSDDSHANPRRFPSAESCLDLWREKTRYAFAISPTAMASIAIARGNPLARKHRYRQASHHSTPSTTVCPSPLWKTGGTSLPSASTAGRRSMVPHSLMTVSRNASRTDTG